MIVIRYSKQIFYFELKVHIIVRRFTTKEKRDGEREKKRKKVASIGVHDKEKLTHT